MCVLILSMALSAAFAQTAVVGGATQSLDGSQWTASSTDAGAVLISAVVPGDLVSDLAAAGVIGDPWLDLTWRAAAGLWDLATWTYTTDFATALAAPTGDVWLVFEAVKMAANISLNGKLVGSVTNQHRRYVFPVGALLLANNQLNTLSVVFPPTVSDTRNDNGRYMGCSGGWDWAAYSNETTGRTPKGIRTFSKGIVGSVYLVAVPVVAILHVKPLIFYRGPYPTSALDSASAGPWLVNVTVYLAAPAAMLAPVTGIVTVAVDWDPSHPLSASVTMDPGAEVAVTLTTTVAAGAVPLWWPAGLGLSQPLLHVNASVQVSGAAAVTAVPRRVGFRALALVTADDSTPAVLVNATGSGTLTMRIRVNGLNLFARGANWIPLEGLESRNTVAAHWQAVASAMDAGMNILRVWGGGVWPFDALLDACDAMGVLLFVDAMYASQSDSHHFATPSLDETLELQHNIRRLAAHPSVAILDACNECGGSVPFDSFVAPTIANEDPSRPIWPSSPSTGWADGVDRLWGLPLLGRALSVCVGFFSLLFRCSAVLCLQQNKKLLSWCVIFAPRTS